MRTHESPFQEQAEAALRDVNRSMGFLTGHSIQHLLGFSLHTIVRNRIADPLQYTQKENTQYLYYHIERHKKIKRIDEFL